MSADIYLLTARHATCVSCTCQSPAWPRRRSPFSDSGPQPYKKMIWRSYYLFPETGISHFFAEYALRLSCNAARADSIVAAAHCRVGTMPY
eukprot:2256070-Pleurochrysis_carterae.AAC.1